MEILGLCILLSVLIYIDYSIYLRGGKSIFFEDKTDYEKNLRLLQKAQLKDALDDYGVKDE